MRDCIARFLALALPFGLAACGGGGGGSAAGLQTSFSYSRNLTPPGPAGDPWGPYIREAASRFAVPEHWIRVVIRQESGGHAMLHGTPTTSAAGAMGLMQLMPATYAMLRDRYGLGNDPYDPHDNILAGTAYIAELYSRYGSPAFLAAYDWGPRHVDAYLAGQASMPTETARYLAAAGPALGGTMTGPLAVYAMAGASAPGRLYASRHPSRAGCDADAAYDPGHSCHGVSPPVEVAEAETTRVDAVLWAPSLPARNQPAPPAMAPAAPARGPRFALIPAAYADTIPVASGTADWGVQVGAFPDPAQARATADSARSVAAAQLAAAQPIVARVVHADGGVWFRARLLGITHPAADTACAALTARHWACLAVPPGG